MVLLALAACRGGGRVPVNQKPIVVALAGLEAAPGDVVVLAADAADPDGTIATSTWSQTGGEAVALDGADQLVASFVAPIRDVDLELGFLLLVTDDRGGTARATVTVHIPANAAPELTIAGPPVAAPGETVVLLASVTNDLGDPPIVGWSQRGGEPVVLEIDGLTASFVAPETRYGSDLVFQATAPDRFGEQATATLPITLRGTIDVELGEAVPDVVETDFASLDPDGFLYDDVPGAGVFEWTRADGVPARNITAPIVRFLGAAGYLEPALLGLEDMYLRTDADPTDPANQSSADLGVILSGVDLTSEARFADLGAEMFPTSVAKYTFDETFPRGTDLYPDYPGLWGYDAQFTLYNWVMADEAGIPGAAEHLAAMSAWYEERYVDQVTVDPYNVIFTNLIADWYGIGARIEGVPHDVEDLGFQYTAFALMSHSVDDDVAAEYLLAHLADEERVSEEVAEGIYALTVYAAR